MSDHYTGHQKEEIYEYRQPFLDQGTIDSGEKMKKNDAAGGDESKRIEPLKIFALWFQPFRKG